VVQLKPYVEGIVKFSEHFFTIPVDLRDDAVVIACVGVLGEAPNFRDPGTPYIEYNVWLFHLRSPTHQVPRDQLHSTQLIVVLLPGDMAQRITESAPFLAQCQAVKSGILESVQSDNEELAKEAKWAKSCIEKVNGPLA
jgi:hypothetical protein